MMDFNKAIELNPDDVDTRKERADMLFEDQCYPEAFLDYKKILEKNPNDAEIHYYIALTLFPMGYYEAGIKHLTTAAKIDRSYQEILDDPYWEEEYGNDNENLDDDEDDL
jgi:tetratricopeptide (TPR) repeat protein